MDVSYGHDHDRNIKLLLVLARVMQKFDRSLMSDIRRHGLTPARFGVLKAFYHKGPLTVNDLIDKTLSTGGNIGLVVDNLIKAGLAEKRRDTAENRVRIVSLTDRGRTNIAEIFPEHLECLHEVTSGLEPDEKSRLLELLQKLCEGSKRKWKHD